MSEGRDREQVGWDVVGLLVALVVFFGLAALIFGPYGQLTRLVPFLRGYGLLLLFSTAVSALTVLLSRWFRLNLYDRGGVFVALGLVASGALLSWWGITAAGWIASASDAANDGGALAFALFTLVGLLSTFVASLVVALFYYGQVYRLVSLAVGVGAYVATALWLTFGR